MEQMEKPNITKNFDKRDRVRERSDKTLKKTQTNNLLKQQQ